jgi:Cft2 family RNA processing exonuclease
MNITFLGGADEVGASAVLVEAAGRRILVDAGIRISPKAHLGLDGDQLPDLSLIDRAGGIDVILLTHAHTDHTGALPLVIEHFPGCPILATPVTAALTRVLLTDARRIMDQRLEAEGELPLFDEFAVERVLAAFHPVPWSARVPLADGLVATWYPSGHIAGAAMIGLECEEGRLLISGDVSISPQRTVAGAKPPPFRPDALILESTYGGRLHANRAVEETRLIDTISRVVEAGGKVLIPAFALGRAQEVILILNTFRRLGRLPEVPVWIDGMVRSICTAYRSFPDALPLALREVIESGQDPFLTEGTQFVTSAGQRNAVMWEPGPAVIVSSSGMLSGGPSPQYARHFARDPKNAILLTGYQDEESPGRRLQTIAERGEGTLRLAGETVKVHCHIGTYSLSAHADEGQLVSLTETLDPTDVMLVHGDGDARSSLGERLAARNRRVQLPRAGQSVTLRYRQSVVIAGFSGIGRNRPLDLARLWRTLADAGGGYYTVGELARAWWGNLDRVDEMAEALAVDTLHFLPDGHRPGLFRARSESQVSLEQSRRTALTALGDPDGLPGQLVVVRPLEGTPVVGRCVSVGLDDLAVEFADSDDPVSQRVWPDQVIEVLGPVDLPPSASDIEKAASRWPEADLRSRLSASPQPLAVLAGAMDLTGASELGGAIESAGTIESTGANELTGASEPVYANDASSPIALAALCLELLAAGAERVAEGWRLPAPIVRAMMEPNAALAAARAAFPPDARLRRAGYRLAEGVLALAFDFPDAALVHHGAQIAAVESQTGWRVEVDPEANQAALVAAARHALPAGWDIAKGPAIHRADKVVALTCRGDGQYRAAIRDAFQALTGYSLELMLVDRLPGAMAAPSTGGEPLEINTAYAAIRTALTGTTLYRTSLKGDHIVLSFISPQVGARYQAEIDSLAARIGWSLAISSSSNQMEILAAAAALFVEAGWAPVRPPGVHLERGEVRVVLPAWPDSEVQAGIAGKLLDHTGFTLVVEAPTRVEAVPTGQGTATAWAGARTEVRPGPAADGPVIQVPLARIQLTASQRATPLDPAKTQRAITRAQYAGGQFEPVRLRRVGDGYRLVDGLRRLAVAHALGWESVPAIVEER